MKRFIALPFLFITTSTYVLPSAAVTASLVGGCLTPAVGTTLTLTLPGADRLAIVLGSTLATSTITPSTSTLFSLANTTAGTVCRYQVTNGGGASMPINGNFTGMTFADPSLTVRNTNSDSTGLGSAGTAASTTMVTLGALAADAITLTNGTAIQVKRRTTGTTTFAFNPATAIPLTAYPTNESSLAATGNAIFTLTITVTQIPG